MMGPVSSLAGGGYTSLQPGCGSSHPPPASGFSASGLTADRVRVELAGDDTASNSNKGLPALLVLGQRLAVSGMAISPSYGTDDGGGTPGVFARWLARPFRLRPSLALIRFQPALRALMARCKPAGAPLNVQSDVGGVVGGVRGSAVARAELLLSSVISSPSAASDEDEPDRLWPSLLRPMLCWDWNVFLGVFFCLL